MICCSFVWSYSFTNYSHFRRKSNAITPRPNWPVRSQADVPISTTPPLNETDYNAMNFSLWRQLGRQVLIKSNINNWLVCDPGSGSLVDWQEGGVNCTIIKQVPDDPSNTLVPSLFFPNKSDHCSPWVGRGTPFTTILMALPWTIFLPMIVSEQTRPTKWEML